MHAVEQFVLAPLVRTHLVYLAYMVLFSAMEFTLVFLTTDRLLYGPTDNAWMFVFVGLILLFLGGELLVRGSVALALKLGVSKLIVAVVLLGEGGHMAPEERLAANPVDGALAIAGDHRGDAISGSEHCTDLGVLAADHRQRDIAGGGADFSGIAAVGRHLGAGRGDRVY